MANGMRLILVSLAAAVIGAPAFAQPVPDTSYSSSIVRAEPAVLPIIFDEGHHNVHMSDGGYLAFTRLVQANGFEVSLNRGPFSFEALSGFRVLVIANAAHVPDIATTTPDMMNEPAFSADETSAIERWVREGGGLFLIADHYPMGGAARDLASMFGVEMGNGWVRDDANHDSAVRAMIFSRENGLLRGHPITEGRSSGERVERIATFTGQSIGADQDRRVAVFGPAAVERNVRDSSAPGRPVGGAAQLVAFEYGAGRVVIAGEAAMFTSQMTGRGDSADRWGGLAFPQLHNDRLTLNIMNWLARRY